MIAVYTPMVAGYAVAMVKAFGYNSNGGPDVQEFLDLEMPSPMPGELLVEVRSAGVNPVDWKIRSGMLGEAKPSDLPGVMGSEVSGVVREVGKDVEGFAVNDEVFGSVAPGSGGYAEYTLVTANAAADKPPQVSFNDAATLPVAAATAYDGVTQLGLKEGQTLLINGVGGGVEWLRRRSRAIPTSMSSASGARTNANWSNRSAKHWCPMAMGWPNGSHNCSPTVSTRSSTWQAAMGCAPWLIWSPIGTS